jgi:hypothetical protein
VGKARNCAARLNMGFIKDGINGVVVCVLTIMLVGPFAFFLGRGSAENVFGMMHESSRMTIEVILHADQLRFFDIAVQELRKQGKEVEIYQASLYREGPNAIVIFKHPDTPFEMIGSSSQFPTFAVEIDRDFRVIRAGLAR